MNPNWESTQNFILLPELKMLTHWQNHKFRTHYRCAKESKFEVCPKCAAKSNSVHDRRWVKIQDHPIRGSGIQLQVLKRRFRCPGCKRLFTEQSHLMASEKAIKPPNASNESASMNTAGGHAAKMERLSLPRADVRTRHSSICKKKYNPCRD
ncbi:MAG: transposase family protein [Bdellovibrionales bacterium]|nr:transposase family protein [Bdellovibrionales bacterium]